jgi:hypothetical protein
MSFLNRKDNKAFKKSINNPDLIFSNFLPIVNVSTYEEAFKYIQNLVDSGNIRDVSTLRQEKNGTLNLEINRDYNLLIYTNEKGYVRTNKDGKLLNLNTEIKVDNDKHFFYEAVEPIKTLEQQLMKVVRFIIYNS